MRVALVVICGDRGIVLVVIWGDRGLVLVVIWGDRGMIYSNRGSNRMIPGGS
jgi:hypothetical protein